jgi:hypothetical protein
MAKSPNDYSAFLEGTTNTDGLATLAQVAYDLQVAEQNVIDAEAALKAAKKAVDDLTERVLPSLMEDLQLKELTLKNGTKLKVDDILQLGSVTKKPEVLAWLEESGNGGLIKRTVSVSLGRNADEQEQALLQELASEGYSDISSARWVEAQTLKAHVKKMLDDGASVDLDMLQARQFKKAKITGKPKDGGSAFGDE